MGQNFYGSLCEAIRAGKVDVVRILLKEHPELVGDCPLGTWLGVAAESDNVPMVAMLVEEFGFEINGPKNNNDAPLQAAARKGRVSVVRWLLDHGAEVNLGGGSYSTPLAAAAFGGYLELVQLLLQRGADPNVIYGTMEYGDPPMNALKVALMYRRDDIAQLLREHGAVLPPGCDMDKPVSGPNNILEHIEKQLGKPNLLALHEIVPGDPPITIQLVPMEDKLALVTTGMSDRPMNVPKGAEQFQFAELLIYLPLSWPLTDQALKDPNNFWPIEWLRRIAHYPHDNKTWLGGPQTIIANDEPPKPLAPNTKMSCILLLAKFGDLQAARLADGRDVVFYTLVPIYTEERDLEKDEGMKTLLTLFMGMSEVVDVNRESVV
jgi:hypothetical protein